MQSRVALGPGKFHVVVLVIIIINNNNKTIALGAILKNFLKKVTRRQMELLTEGQNYAKSALLGSATI